MSQTNEPKLEDFTKEALISFIKKSFYFGRRRWWRELQMIECQIEFDRIHTTNLALIEVNGKLKLPRDYVTWEKNTKQIEENSKRLDEVLQRMATCNAE